MTATIRNIEPLIDRYDGFIIDLWGVMHDGGNVFPEALKALQKIQQAGKSTCFLTNAPRPRALVEQSLEALGIERNMYTALHSSGEDCRQHFLNQLTPFYENLGNNGYLVGHLQHQHILDDSSFHWVDDLAHADFILVSATMAYGETLEQAIPLLETALEKRLPLICANPDAIVYVKGREHVCCGALAQWYEKQGGIVSWHGKPYHSVYATAMQLLHCDDPTRILAIGDNLHTDIVGGRTMGMATLLIAGGVHRQSFSEEPTHKELEILLSNLFSTQKIKSLSAHIPNYLAAKFTG